MSCYSLTEALKYSCKRSQWSPPIASIHKSCSEPSDMMTAEQHIKQQPPPPRRRNDEIVSVPVRPWHSPRVRDNGLYSDYPPSFSQEANSVWQTRLNQLNCLTRQQNYFMPEHSSESIVTNDSKTVRTEICVSDTISKDPSVSDNYPCKRSARISYSKNCSNSIRQMDSKLKHRSSRRQRAGDSKCHQQPQDRQDQNPCNQLPGTGYGSRQDWPADGRCTGTHQMHDNTFNGNYLMSTHLSGLSAVSNANCLADLQNTSLISDPTERNFGCEDLKVRALWQDVRSNDESGTEATMTDDLTCSAELGTDLSALTLSHTELSSTAAAHNIVEPRRVSRGLIAAGSAEDANCHSKSMKDIRYQLMQTSSLPSLQVPQMQYQEYHDYQQQKGQREPHQTLIGHQSGTVFSSLVASNRQTSDGIPPLVATNRHAGRDSHALIAINHHASSDYQAPIAVGRRAGSDNPTLNATNRQSGTGSPTLVATYRHSASDSQALVNTHRQAGNNSPPLVTTNRQACKGSSPRVATNRQADKDSPPLVATNRQADKDSPPQVATNRQADNGSPPLVATNRKASKVSPPRVATNRKASKGSPLLVATNRRASKGSQQLVTTNRQTGSGSSPLVDKNCQAVSGRPQLDAVAKRQAPTHVGDTRNPISYNSSNSSFSLNQSEFSSRESVTSREELIPASDDLVHLSVASCSEAASGSEAEASTVPDAETEGKDKADRTTLCDDIDRVPIEASEEHHPRVHVRLRVSQKQQQQQQPKQHQQQQHQLRPSAQELTDASSLGAAAMASTVGRSLQVNDSEACRHGVAAMHQSSRYGRLKTPEYCKCTSFLSALRHSLAPGHTSRKAMIKSMAAPVGHRPRAGI